MLVAGDTVGKISCPCACEADIIMEEPDNKDINKEMSRSFQGVKEHSKDK